MNLGAFDHCSMSGGLSRGVSEGARRIEGWLVGVHIKVNRYITGGTVIIQVLSSYVEIYLVYV